MASNWQQTFEELKKKKKEIDKAENKKEINNINYKYNNTTNNRTMLDGYGNNKIAPISNYVKATTVPITQESKKRTWFSGGKFSDGYDFGDITKTILGTAGDIGVNATKGIASAGEGLSKLVVGGVAEVSDWIGQDDYADKLRNRLSGKDEKFNERKDKYFVSSNLNKVSDKLDSSSFTGEKLDDLSSSVGNLGGAIAGQSVGIPWYVTMGGSSAGNELENAYTQGATSGEAWTSAIITGASEVLLEKLSGGIKFGGKTLDEGAKKLLSNAITNKTAQTLTKFGLDVIGEGTEEVLTEIVQNVGRKLTYEDEKTWGEILASEEALDNYLEAFIGGAVMGGGFNAGRLKKSLQTGQDYDSVGVNSQEETTDPIAPIEEATVKENLSVEEIDNQISVLEQQLMETESETEYQRLSEEIKTLEQRAEQLENNIGPISEQISNTTNQVTKTNSPVDVVSNTQNIETDAKRRNFTYDSEKVTNEYSQATYESASRVMNDTERSHKFVDVVAKIATEKNTKYEFTNNEDIKSRGYNIEGKQVNGLVTVEENGATKILINIDSPKALNTIVGHETTHLLEGTQEYKDLQDAIFKYAKTKGELDDRKAKLHSLYKDVKGADVNSELTADLVGDYLFTDSKFIESLSVEKPTLFQKIKELIDDLVIRFKGTKEEKQLREVQKKFKEAYKTSNSQNNTDTKYMITGKKGIDKLVKKDSSYQYVKDNYDKALEMKEEGKTNKEIWEETLWFQDEEGKWKIEISDRDARLKIKPEKNKKYKLKDILNHEDLYEIYPKTKNITVKFKNIKDNVDPDTGKNRIVAGYYNPLTGAISLNNKLLDMNNGEKYVINTILHEVQHKIQKYEGFNYGYKGNDEAGYFKNLGEREAKDTERRRNLSYKERSQIAPTSLFEENSNSLYNSTNGGNINETNQKNKTILSKSLYDANERSIDDGRRNQSDVEEIENPYYIDEELDNSSFFNTKYSLTDNQGRKLSKEQQEYFKDSKVRDENGNLTTAYHTTTDEMVQFNEFNPVGTDYYRFGDQVVNYFTNSQEMSGSYANQHYTKVKTNKLNSVEEAKQWVKNLNETEKILKPKTFLEWKLEKNSKGQWIFYNDGTIKIPFESDTDMLKKLQTTWEKQSNIKHKYQYEGYLNITNPYVVDAKGKNWDSVSQKIDENIEKEYNKIISNEETKTNLKNLYKESQKRYVEYINSNDYKYDKYLADKFKALPSKIQEAMITANMVGEKYTDFIKEWDNSLPIDSIKVEGFKNPEIDIDDFTRMVMEARDNIQNYGNPDSYFKNEYENITGVLQNISGDKLSLLASIDFEEKGLGISNLSPIDILGEKHSTNDIVKQVLEMNKNGANYDGVIIKNTYDYGGASDGDRKANDVYVTFNSNQFKNIDNTNPTTDEDIRYSLSNQNEDIAPIGNYNVYGDEVKLQVKEAVKEIAPVQKEIKTLTKEVKNLTKELQEVKKIAEVGKPVTLADLEDFYKQTDAEFRMVEEDIPAPPRNEDTTPDYEYENDNEGSRSKIESPLIAEGRDMDNVGSRKVKAYQYENPEVRPFFREMAKEMQYDLMNSTKGERIIIGDISQTGGGDFEYSGVKRHTTPDIADLLDNYNYTYSDIYKGLEAIIKDHGAENIAIAKRIEFALDDRLRNGYTAVDGLKIPANQDYIDLLNEKSWTDYYSSIPNNDIAPIETNLEQDSVIAPTTENIAETSTNQSLAIEQAPTEFDNGGPMIRVSPEMQKRTLNKSIESKNVDWEALEDTSKGEQQNLKVKKLGETIERKDVDWDSLEDTSNAKQKQYNTETEQIEDAIEKKTKKEIKEKLLKETGIMNASLDEANNISKFLMENTDPIRLQEMVFGRGLGNQINDMFFQKVKDNTSKKIRFQNKERAEIKNLGIKARSKESAAVQKYGEKQWVNELGEVVPYGDKELANDFPDVEVQNKIKKASQIIRQKYDSYLDETNKVLTELGYDAIPKREDYMRHFQELNDIFSRVGIPYNYNEMTANDLPTDINGLTHDFSPSKNFFANALKRTGNKTTYDAITGIDGYLEGIGNLIYHTEDIQRLRAYEQYIRDTYGQNHGFDNIETLSDEQKAERIEKIQDNHLSNYASWLHEYTNTLAGKKSLVDRGIEHLVGRRIYSFLNTTKSQVGKNMIGFNISSAMTNAIAGVQSLAKTNKIASVKGLADSVKNIFRNDGFVDKNNFLTSRFGSDSISKNWWQRVGDAGFVFMQGMDHFVSNFVVRSKYNELKSKGLSDEQAHIEAGKFASRLMSDRSQGAMPNLYNSQMLGIVTQFQNEVNNQLYSMFYDTYHESRESAQGKALKTTAGMTFTLGQLAVFTHIFGTAFESMAGYNPTFDIIGILMKAFGFDDDEDSEDTVGDNLEQAFKQLGSALPYISILTGGGRIPISEALPIGELVSGKDEFGNDKSRLKTLSEALPYYVLPTGFSQAKKTVQGLGMYDEDLPIAGSYTDSGNLRFTADESTWGKVQAGIFGRWANDEAQAYVDSEFKTINKSSIDELVDLGMKSSEYRKLKEKINKSGKKVEDKVDYIATLNELTDSQKNILVNNILDRDYDVDVSNYEDYSSYDEFNFYYKNREKYDWLKEEGISYEEYSATDESKELYNYAYRYPETYKVGKAITGDFATYKEHADYIWDLKADKDENGDSISGTKKTKVIEYVNSLDLSIPQKAMLIRKTYSSFDDYNNDIVDYIESLDEDYDTKKTILEELDFTLDEDGYVYWD